MFPSEIDLARLHAVACGVGEGVVIVVPALAEGKRRNPFVVAGGVTAVEDDIAPAMGGGVHKPSDVIDDHEAQGNPPQHQGPTAGACSGADPEQQQAKGELQPEKVSIQPAVIGISHEIACETRHCGHGLDRVEHPTHVAPPEAAMAVVMIRIRIRKLVVMPVQSHPVDRAVLAAQGAAGCEKAFQPLR